MPHALSDTQRTASLHVRLTEEEAETVRLRAIEAGLSISEFARRAVLEAPSVSERISALEARVARIEGGWRPNVEGKPWREGWAGLVGD